MDSITESVSVVADPGSAGLTIRIPPGVYKKKAASGYPEIRVLSASNPFQGSIQLTDSRTANEAQLVYSRTFQQSEGYKAFLCIFFCTDANGYQIIQTPSISSGSITNVGSIDGQGYIYAINNIQFPFTINVSSTRWLWSIYMYLYGIK